MRVLVARPRAQAEQTAERLRERGHLPVLAPVLAIVPTGLPPPDGEPDALLVTSRSAVPALALLHGRFGSVPILAVGPRTGEDLAAAGFRRISCAEGDGVSLARAATARLPAGARLVHVAGRDRRPEPDRSLLAAGYDVAVWEAYAAEPAARLPETAREALRAEELDAALHYSPRSAALLLRLVREAGLGGAFGRLRHLCLSSNVARALADAGDLGIAVAPEPSEDKLLALLDGHARGTDRRAGSPSAQKRC